MLYLAKLFGLWARPKQVCLDEYEVIYAGSSESVSSNSFQFGVYVQTEDVFCWLPATTSNESVIKMLESMQIGTVFKILSEENGDFDQGLGVYPKEISLSDPLKIYKINANSPAFIYACDLSPSI